MVKISKMKNFYSKCTINLILIHLIFLVSCSKNSKDVSISFSRETPQSQFVFTELKTSLELQGYRINDEKNNEIDIVFVIEPENTNIRSEGFALKKEPKKITVVATDDAGAMYGGLELAEQIRLYGIDGVKPVQQNPYMQMRGTKFNIPLDVRTPSYSDPSDAAQKNMAEMWNYDFWTEYIDNIARYRYNFISLWSLHPFPSMVKVPGYEDIALDDVRRSTVEWEEHYHAWGIGFDAPEIVDNYEVLKKITIDEKIEFWKRVMSYAKSRNVTFYVVTWNIFVNGTEGKYGISDKIDNKVTRDYFKQSVKAMFNTYPDLGGIGITTGENMHDIPFNDKEDWAYETYAEGMLELANENPERDFKFIHRQHQSDSRAIEEKFASLIKQKNIDFIYSFKYAKAHVMSAVKQPYHQDFVKNIGDVKTIWTLRNDDNYYFRWGAPDFVREFIQNIPQEASQGMYYGSDQWIWGREFTMKDVVEPRQLEVTKHWYHWMMWGRLCYNPEMANDRFMDLLHDKFTEVDPKKLFDAWQEASLIYPVTTGFHWGTIDLRWYIEGCRSRPPNTSFNETGFHDVNTFIKFPVHPSTDNITIPDYVQTVISGTANDSTTPLQVALKLHRHAEKSFKLLSELEKESNSQELKYTLNDIKTMAFLGKYYAYKIAGSTNVALYRETKDKKYQEVAVDELTQALDAWKSYAQTAMQQNINPIWTNRVGYVDWVKTTQWVENDIEISKEN